MTSRSRVPQSPTTITEVAREARVGESTVSRVVRGRGSVSESTRQRVLSAVERLGYVPNRIAGTLASSGSKLVGIIVPSVTNSVFPDVLQGANMVLERAQFQSVIGVTEYDPVREERLIESLLSWRPSAIIVAGLEHTARARTMLKKSGVRVAELLDIDGDGVDIVVGFSNHLAGRASAEHLLTRGYRRIGYVGHNLQTDLRAAKRYRSFCEVLNENGMTIVDEEITQSASSLASGRQGLARLLERKQNIDAVYFSNDDMAIGGYFHCLAEGISIPNQLALFGYNGIDVSKTIPQPLSTINTPRTLIGETGARLILSGASAKKVDLGFEVVAGATT